MAPSRRKGASKAAAAAAARRQWKVGDLVLAKVKGFPAWPATVSEPEKWGYSADWKKVLVYFFGTQQIAFCNPADVEPFTEEKKESLLGKRHGKGADFVRAVHEIIDSYEKMKTQVQANTNSPDEDTASDGNNLVGSSAKSVLKKDAVSVVLCQEIQDSAEARNGINLPTEASASIEREDDGHDREMQSEEPSQNLRVMEVPTSDAYSSKRKLEGIQPQNRVTRGRASSVRRSRSSSRANPNRQQNLLLPPGTSSNNAGHMSKSSLRDRSTRTTRNARQSSDVSDRTITDFPVFVSNGSVEEESEILNDSDSHSLNEGSTVESDCKPVQPESGVEREVDIDLSHRLEFQNNSIIRKKKRKPSRKRPDPSESMIRSDKEISSDAAEIQNGHILPSDNEKSTEIHSKEDGDGHLPLVKRARVRMSQSLATEEVESSAKGEENVVEVPNNPLEHVLVSMNQVRNDSTIRNAMLVKGDQESSSFLEKISSAKPKIWEVGKNQQFGSLVDGEAALPPSKRLHRALEAMSANASEDCHTPSDGPPVMKTLMNSLNECSEKFAEGKVEIEVETQKNIRGDTSEDSAMDICARSNSPVIGENAKSSTLIETCSKTLCIGSISQQTSGTHMLNAVDCAENKNLKMSPRSDGADQTATLKSPSPDFGERLSSINCGLVLQEPFMLANDECRTEGIHLAKPSGEPNPEISGVSLSPCTAEEVCNVSTKIGVELQVHSAACKSDETNKLTQLSMDEKHLDYRMCEHAKETRPILKDSATISFADPDVVNRVHQGLQLSHSYSVSDDGEEDKAASVSQSCSSLSGGLESGPRPSPPSSSVCYTSTLDKIITVGNNSCSGTSSVLHNEKLKPLAKSSYREEANVALTSFQTILKTLTRTKESIGRATRVAIDCAKFGDAAKVVEIIASNLESESSLHRRVDLFFLVDSITQCSRSLKGDVAHIYPSAIQGTLPRLLLAAAPPGSSSQENRRQCLKVLRVWQERRILPESVLRHHIRELDSRCTSSSSGAFSRRPLRTERAFDDPIREMEGMLVDEYGSNSSFQLPGFCMPPMLRDEDGGSDSDAECFEAVTPEHNAEVLQGEHTPVHAIERHRRILEDVDGELEMEDVAPSFEAETNSMSCIASVDNVQTSHHHMESHQAVPFAPPLPKDVPPSSPPLPTSPPPPPPAPPLPTAPASFLLSAIPDSTLSGPDQKLYTSSRNIKDDLIESTKQQPVSVPVHIANSDAVQYHVPESGDFRSRMPMQMTVSARSSHSSQPVSHPPLRMENGIHSRECVNKSFHVRPPHPAPSNQFSYVQADQHLQSRRDIPPQSYQSRYHAQNAENGYGLGDHGRMKFAPLEIRESWRSPPPPFSGPGYSDDARRPYAPRPYAGEHREPAFPNHRWNLPPRTANHREFFAHRPPSQGPIPAGTRGPQFWRPR